MTELLKKILAYGLSGAATLVAMGWGARVTLDEAKAEFKGEILREVGSWRKEDMAVIQAIKEDTSAIKVALIKKAVR